MISSRFAISSHAARASAGLNAGWSAVAAPSLISGRTSVIKTASASAYWLANNAARLWRNRATLGGNMSRQSCQTAGKHTWLGRVRPRSRSLGSPDCRPTQPTASAAAMPAAPRSRQIAARSAAASVMPAAVQAHPSAQAAAPRRRSRCHRSRSRCRRSRARRPWPRRHSAAASCSCVSSSGGRPL
jgi:hypothetical protein